jgi:hypothetical protein
VSQRTADPELEDHGHNGLREDLDGISDRDPRGLTRTDVVLAWAFANWHFLLVSLASGLVVGLGTAMLQPPRYVAEALIAPARTRTQVQFQNSIQTVGDTPSSGSLGSAAVPPASPERRQALADLVNNSTVETRVIPNLAGTFAASDLRPGQLLAHIHGGLKPRSEIISIQADGDDPIRAVVLANAWATAYADLVNGLYGNGDSASSLSQLEAQRDEAFAQQEATQNALTSTLRSNSVDALTREVADKSNQLAMWYRAGVVGSGRDTSKPDPSVDDYRLAEARTLDDLAQTLRRLDVTRESIRTLATQSNVGPSDAAAITLAKAQLVSISGAPPTQLQFQVPATSTGNTAADLSGLITSIDTGRAAVAKEFDSRRADYEARRTSEIQRLESELRSLRADLEAQTGVQKQQTLQRDLSWTTYNALASKVEERKVAYATGGQEVEIASQATVASSAARGTAVIVGLAGLIGLVGAAALIIVRAGIQRASAASRRLRKGMRPSPVG